MMFERFFPSRMVDSVRDIDFEKEYQKGVRAVFFDVDNTLVPHDAPADEDVIALFETIRKKGLKTCIISNNNEERVKPFADAVKSPYVFLAEKPSKEGYERAEKTVGEKKEHCLFVGDQLFTDIYGANRAGIESVLTAPVDPATDIPRIRFKRKLEKIVMKSYYRKHPAI